MDFHGLQNEFPVASMADIWDQLTHKYEPGIEQVQALADISRSALCCHSNKTRAPIANLPNTAQLEGTPTIP